MSSPASTTNSRGSSASSKAMFHAAKNGRLVTAHLPTGDVSGYLTGTDDFHWVLITPEADRTVLVHKTCPAVTISSRTYETEDRKDEIARATSPFRSFVLQQNTNSN